MQLPPPPPRSHHQQHGGALPPPPSAPAPLANSAPYWNRQASSYPPPPPANSRPAYNPSHYQSFQQQQQIAVPPKDTSNLVSATFMPSGPSWGPSVGLLPPDDSYDPVMFDPYQVGNAGAPLITPIDPQPRPADAWPYPQLHPVPKPQPYPPPAQAVPAQQPVSQIVNAPSQSLATGPLSPSDPGYQWPLERVINYLAQNGFSQEWVDAFRDLELSGNNFLDIGRGTRSNLPMMHNIVYPYLQQKLRPNYNATQEHAQGKKLRRMIQRLLEQSGDPSSNTSLAPSQHRREQSLNSAGTDGTVETSPGISTGYNTLTPTTAGASDDSPHPGGQPTQWQQRRASSSRPINDFINDSGRSQWSQDALSQIGSRTSRPSSQEFQDGTGRLSPQPSPAMQPSNSQQGHGRAPSSDSSFARRNGYDASRLSPLEGRADVPASASKEHRGLLSRITGRGKKDDHHPSPDESSVDSPTTSPNFRQPLASFFKKNSSAARSAAGSRLSAAMEDDSKKYVFLTMDGINYRLVDLTSVDSPQEIRRAVRKAMGLHPGLGCTLHLTSPMQADHEDALTDDVLLAARQTLGDMSGTLKLLVHLEPEFDMSVHEAGVASMHEMDSTPQRVDGATSSGADEAYFPLSRPNQSPEKALPDMRKPVPQSPDDPKSLSVSSNRVVDFDNRRDSPYEQKPDQNRKSRDLVPTRPPPAAPADSKMLQKANSLTKKGHKPARSGSERNGSTATETILEATENRGDSPVGTRKPAMALDRSRGSSPGTLGREPSGRGRIPFRVTDYNPDRDDPPANEATTSSTGSNRPILTLRVPVSGSPSTQVRQIDGPMWPEKPKAEANGPKAPAPAEPAVQALDDDDDSDSDDSLFAVQINRPGMSEVKGKSPVKDPPVKPRVQFHQMPAEPPIVLTDEEPLSDKPTSAASSNAEERNGLSYADRRRSFATDVWAARPSGEAIVDNLDAFFPGVNLDQPVIPEVAPWADGRAKAQAEDMDTLGSEDSTLKRGDTVASVAQRRMQKSGGGLTRARSIREAAQRSYQSGTPPLATAVLAGPSVAQQQPAAPNRVSTLREGALGAVVRRKSTKMFGARIEQVKPTRGSRMISLEPIPQDDIPVMSHMAGPMVGVAQVPQPATFRWMRGEMIGKGTFGKVYLGMNMTTIELIAVKQVDVNPRAAGTEKERMKEMLRSLDVEIEMMESLEHPNIVTYLGSEKSEMSMSIFLEYVPGGSIGSVLRKHGKFEESIVSSLTRQTLDGLAYLHDEGILHRDLKADNILLDLTGAAKISDFGISKKTDNIYGNDAQYTMQGSVFWMAPEVVRSKGRGYSAKVDVWSLGCVVLEMFAGRRPWGKEEAVHAMYKLGKLNEAPPIPDDVSQNITPKALSFMWDCFQM
jgi:mitogen-activated protein kinase kinase kinase